MKISQLNRALIIGLALHTWSALAATQTMRLSLPIAGKNQEYNVNALLTFDPEIKNQPLAVLSHGSVAGGDQSGFRLESMLPMAERLSNRGFMTLIVERRGFGESTKALSEVGGPCDDRNYINSGESASRDILGAIIALQKSSYTFDVNRILLIGKSAGGYSSLFSGAAEYPAIKAVVNISGGRGEKKEGGLCSEEKLMQAMETIGAMYKAKNKPTPTLWLYAQNDSVFNPDLAQLFFSRFQNGGGTGKITITSPFGKNGHNLFSADGSAIWEPLVVQFLNEIQF